MLKTLNYNTRGSGCEVINITDDVQDLVGQSEVKEGIVVVSVAGSTAGITTTEFEPNTIEDIKDFFEKIIPSNQEYKHNLTWGDGNGFAHLRSTILGCSQSFAIAKGQMIHGTWQQIILIDFDNKPHDRKVMVKIING